MSTPRLYIGCAGWSIPSIHGAEFHAEGSHLERYALALPAVEINSSFYRPHQSGTYARWRNATPDDFRFSVKLPKQITHALRLRQSKAALGAFLLQTAALEAKLGCFLVQLPPSLAFDGPVAEEFFGLMRASSAIPVVLEPRHVSWTCDAAREILQRWKVGFVYADPNRIDMHEPVIAGDTVYLRLHGSPVIYRSSYSDAYLAALAERMAAYLADGKNAWCIFDNTASGAAVRNALDLSFLCARQFPPAQHDHSHG